MGIPAGQLRSHIPIGGPARRELADGTEKTMRVSLGFEPVWYTKKCGIDFSEFFHKDPQHRFNSIGIMKEELVKAFPSVPYWGIQISRRIRQQFPDVTGHIQFLLPLVFPCCSNPTGGRCLILQGVLKSVRYENR